MKAAAAALAAWLARTRLEQQSCERCGRATIEGATWAAPAVCADCAALPQLPGLEPPARDQVAA